MPVRKCSNGKYRIGKGQCLYKSRASAERAYKGYLGAKYGESIIARTCGEVREQHALKPQSGKRKSP